MVRQKARRSSRASPTRILKSIRHAVTGYIDAMSNNRKLVITRAGQPMGRARIGGICYAAESRTGEAQYGRWMKSPMSRGREPDSPCVVSLSAATSGIFQAHG